MMINTKIILFYLKNHGKDISRKYNKLQLNTKIAQTKNVVAIVMWLTII